MRFKKHLKNNPCLLLFDILDILEFNKNINEGKVRDIAYNSLKTLGNKLGFKVRRSDSIFDYLARAEENLVDLITYLTLYVLAKDGSQKKELKDEIFNLLKMVNTKEITAFFMQVDRGFFGITSHLRHVLMSIFGVEISTYNKWVDDFNYIEKTLKDIRKVLMRMDPSQEELNALENFELIMSQSKKDMNLKEEITGCSSGATTTDNVEKFWPKLGPTTRRRKRKKLNKLL